MKGYYFTFITCLLLYACANPVAPSGGDKDIEAPKVFHQQPASGSANYQGDVIEIWFDEYVTVSTSEQNVLITPSMPERPQFVVKGKKLIIKLPDGLDPSLTYSITFIDAVKDFTEGNILNNLKYVFSKGPAIDSASVSGRVVDAEFNNNVEGVFVGLYNISDTGILNKSKPVYLAPANKQGTFTLDYVKEGDYIIAAIQDKNLNYIFDLNSEKISLPSAPLSVQGNMTIEEDIRIFQNETAPSIEGYKVLNNNELYFYFNAEIENLGLDIQPYSESNLTYLNKGNDTLFYHWTDKEISQIEFFFELNQLNNDTITVPLKTQKDNLKISIKDKLPKNQELEVNFPKPILQVDAKRILIRDSLKNDLSSKMSYVKKQLFLNIENLKEGQVYVEIDSGAIEYFDGTWNSNRFMKFVDIIEAQEKSKLLLLFDKAADQNTYLELLNKDNRKLESYDISGLSKLNISELNPGTFFVKIYNDENQNGKWTTGNFEQGRPPEKVYMISQAIEIKLNWDKELNLSF